MDTVLAFLQQHLPNYLADLETLVNVDCGTDHKPGVDAVGEMMQAWLEAIGCNVIRFPLADYGDCRLATLQGAGQARVLLIGHLDTVYPVGTVAERPLRFEGDRAIGPGVTDMKAGLLTGLYALKALRATGFDEFAEIGFFLNSDEEVGSPVSRTLYTEAARRADVALVLEAARANGDIVGSRKGGGLYVLTVHGRAAHAGVEPEKGANAIVELAHQIQELWALNGLHPGTTVSPGIVQGGSRTNVVPDLARVKVDVRVGLPEAIEPLDQAIRQLAAQPQVAGTHVEVEGGINTPPMPHTPAIAFLARLAQAAARDLGFEIGIAHTGGTSDANYVAASGTPVLDGLGPIGGLDHSPDEYLEVDSIVPRTALLARLIQSVCRERDGLTSIG